MKRTLKFLGCALFSMLFLSCNIRITLSPATQLASLTNTSGKTDIVSSAGGSLTTEIEISQDMEINPELDGISSKLSFSSDAGKTNYNAIECKVSFDEETRVLSLLFDGYIKNATDDSGTITADLSTLIIPIGCRTITNLKNYEVGVYSFKGSSL